MYVIQGHTSRNLCYNGDALRRFICRRGPVHQIRSDQGTNFVGASKELKQALTEFNYANITTQLLKRNCDWIQFKFNVPSALRSVFFALLQSNGSQLDDESLRTLMCETEAIVNSRPLTEDDLNDPDSLQPLMPMILSLSSNLTVLCFLYCNLLFCIFVLLLVRIIDTVTYIRRGAWHG
jgi:hypothetical protein